MYLFNVHVQINRKKNNVMWTIKDGFSAIVKGLRYNGVINPSAYKVHNVQ